MRHGQPAAPPAPTMSPSKPPLLQLFVLYLRLGCLSFGGPVAHLAYFKEAFVSQRKWLSEERYAELLALCQFIPGPSSSQLGFAIGWQRAGLRGAALAWLGFTLPSALLMIAFAYGLTAIGERATPLIHGLLIAAVAVVAKAVLDLGKKLCADTPRMLIALLSATLATCVASAYTQMAAILLAVGLGNLLFRHAPQPHSTPHDSRTPVSPHMIYWALGAFAALLAGALLIPADASGALLAMHYRAGAMVFGGGHVVLPLLHDSVVPSGLLSESHFLAGYSGAQALPGPLFSLSAFLGTASQISAPAWLAGLAALLAIFLPGLLLLLGLLPLWQQLRTQAWAQAGLIGANAAVVGLLLAAFIDPVWRHGIQRGADLPIALISFIALSRFKAPAWLVVLGCGAFGACFR